MNSQIPDVLFLRAEKKEGEQSDAQEKKPGSDSTPISRMEATLSSLTGNRSHKTGSDVRFVNIVESEELQQATEEASSANRIATKKYLQPKLKKKALQLSPEQFDHTQNIFQFEVDSVLTEPQEITTNVLADSIADAASFRLSEQTQLDPAVTSDHFSWPAKALEICENYSERFLTWHTSSLKKTASNTPCTIGVLPCDVSPISQDLSAAISKILASRKTADDHDTLLMDVDLYDPKLNGLLKKNLQFCWTNENSDSYNLNDCLARSNEDNLDLLTLNCAVESDQAVSGMQRKVKYVLPANYLEPLVDRYRFVHQLAQKHYQKIVLNLAPLGFLDHLGQLNTILGNVDQVLLLCHCPRDERTVSKIYWQLQELGIENILIIENDLT